MMADESDSFIAVLFPLHKSIDCQWEVAFSQKDRSRKLTIKHWLYKDDGCLPTFLLNSFFISCWPCQCWLDLTFDILKKVCSCVVCAWHYLSVNCIVLLKAVCLLFLSLCGCWPCLPLPHSLFLKGWLHLNVCCLFTQLLCISAVLYTTLLPFLTGCFNFSARVFVCTLGCFLYSPFQCFEMFV